MALLGLSSCDIYELPAFTGFVEVYMGSSTLRMIRLLRFLYLVKVLVVVIECYVRTIEQVRTSGA